jgi:hypothetical protein
MVSAKRPSKSACPDRREGRVEGSFPKAGPKLISEPPKRSIYMDFSMIPVLQKNHDKLKALG